MGTQIEKAKSAVNAVRVRPMSSQVAAVRNNINLIQEAMKATMKKDVHFGTIPGCPKPSLYKAGAEVIMALFSLSTDPIVTDLSKDREIRYQVKVNITNRDGKFIGSGIGECSSAEEKYMWRSAVCTEEFEATLESMRRIKFKKDRYKGTVEQIQQVRVNPGDMANTILKMAKKRALIDAVLTATGASDIFSQDIEDLPEGYIPPEAVQVAQAEAQKPQVEQTPLNPDTSSPLPDNNAPEAPQKATAPVADLITDPQRKRLYAIARQAGMSEISFKAWLLERFGYSSSKDITREYYDQICQDAQEYNPVEG